MERIIKYAFLLFVFLLPWQTRLIWRDAFLNGDVWEYGRLSLYGTEILLWLILILFFSQILNKAKFTRLSLIDFLNSLKRSETIIYWLIVLFTLLAVGSVGWSIDSQLAYYTWLHLAEAVAMLVLILMSNIKFEELAACFVASAAIQGLFGIWQFFTQSVFAGKWLGLALHLPNSPGAVVLQTASERWLRAYGSFPHPNMLGGFLVIGWLFLFYLATLAKSLWQRILILAALLLITPALFFSFSRSAILALILSIIILGAILYFRQEKNYFNVFIKIAGLTLLIMIILSAIYWPIVAGRLMGGERLEDASISQRLDYTRQSLQLIGDHWLGGVGFGNYTLGIYQNISSAWPGYYYQPVHNIYLLIFSELGIFGAVLFGVIILFLIYFGCKSVRANGLSAAAMPQALQAGCSPLRLEQVIILLCFLEVLLIGLFDHYLVTLYFGIMVFWLIIALNLKYLRERKKSLDTP